MSLSWNEVKTGAVAFVPDMEKRSGIIGRRDELLLFDILYRSK